MKTITVQIGNSDDRLTQVEWNRFVIETGAAISALSTHVHFFGGSENWQRWQNVCWLFEIEESKATGLKDVLIQTRKYFRQHSLAWTESKATEMI